MEEQLTHALEQARADLAEVESWILSVGSQAPWTRKAHELRAQVSSLEAKLAGLPEPLPRVVDLDLVKTAEDAVKQGLDIEYTKGKGKQTGIRYCTVYVPRHTILKHDGMVREVVGLFRSHPTPVGTPINWTVATRHFSFSGRTIQDLDLEIASWRKTMVGTSAPITAQAELDRSERQREAMSRAMGQHYLVKTED